MVRKAFIILAVIQGACSSGPAQLDDYRPAAVVLNARFADAPAGIITPTMLVDSMGYCPPNSGGETELKEVELQQSDVFPFAAEHSQVEILSSGGAYLLNLQCGSGVRFFRTRAYLYQQQTISPDTPSWTMVGAWAPIGYDLVYAPSDATFAPFGPGGPTLGLPKGYAWLHRTCGASPGSIAIGVVDTSEIVEFHHSLQPFNYGLPPDNLAIEQSERDLVESCGAIVPAPDLGLRLSFDRAQAMVWAPDGTTLYYLAPFDSRDPSHSVGLRQLHFADLVASELATVPFANNLQIDGTGQLYVGNQNNLLQVGATPDGKAILVTLPVPADAVPSPDGHWLAYTDQRLHVWDIQSGADRITVDGVFRFWLPDSTLAYLDWTTGSRITKVLSPTTLGDPTVYGSGDPDGPYVVQVPLDWSSIRIPYVNSGGGCQACFGLSVVNLADGTRRQILDASAGRITIVPAPSRGGLTLVWARTCLGLYDTVCTESLLRIGLAEGTAQTVAVAPQIYPLAVSPDNQRVAIAAPSGIYVKSLAQ
jgi:hypothetical protein